MTTTTAGISYNTASFNSNFVIGNPSNLPLRPDMTAYCGTVTFGGLTTPLTGMNINSLGTVNINSLTGLSLLGGGGISIAGAGAISAVGSTITLGAGAVSALGGSITLGAGTVSALGGSINLGGGTINMAGGLINALGTAVNVGGGLITATTGGLLVTAGSVVVGTSSNAGAGMVCYGGKIQTYPSITGGSGGLEMNSCPITGVTTINGAAYPPSVNIGVETLNTLSGNLTIAAGTNISVISSGDNTLTINNTAPAGVSSFNSATGDITLVAAAGIDIQPITSTSFGVANTGIRSLTVGATTLNNTGVTLVAGTNISLTPSGGNTITINNTQSLNSSIPYTLTGTTGGGVITNRAIGNLNPFPLNLFTLATTITFNLPSILNATDSIYYDGSSFYDFFTNFNSYWGVSYFTNTYATETDILGSTTNTANALNFSNIQQIYLPLNLIIPPTHITSGGTVTLKIYCNPTSTNQYITIAPINNARIGIVRN